METENRPLPNILQNAAKFGCVEVCRAIPFIGDTTAAIAQRIIDLAETAQRNEEVCKDIAERVKKSLEGIAECEPDGDLKKAQEAYRHVLKGICHYVKQMNKTDKGVLQKLMEMFNSDKTSEMHSKVIKKLEDATNDFYNKVALDTNTAVKRIEGKILGIDESINQLAQFALLQEGVRMADAEIDELQIDPFLLKDCTDCIKRGKIRKCTLNGEEVAVKDMGGISLKNIAEKMKIVQMLSQENIEKFYGAYTESVMGKDCLFVVTEWMQDSDLETYLRDNKLIPWTTKFEIAEQIAKGLSFCIGKKVYHRDVRSKNVLLTEKDGKICAKLTNFKMSRRVKDPTTKIKLDTIRWTAPEKFLFPGREYTDKCETYSFAILLWEISTHQYPFSNIEDDIDVEEKVKAGERPNPFSNDTPEQYKKLVEEAWDQSPDKRPKLTVVREKLYEIRYFKLGI